MGAEHGATTSVFPFDQRMATYLKSTNRADVAELASTYADYLVADSKVYSDPEKYYDRLIEIDLNTLEPHIVGPHSPDVTRPVSQMASDARENDYPTDLSYALIGSCTNSSYEDIGRSTDLAKQAQNAGLKTKIPLLVTPGSDQIKNTIERDGQSAELTRAGATVLANACGPCIGQWQRDDIEKGDRNSIISSYNRNFRGRNDGNAETLSFIGSPELVTAIAFSGQLDFNPLVDSIDAPDGTSFKFSEPVADELPANGFVPGLDGFSPPPKNADGIEVDIAPESERLQKLERFAPWNGEDLHDMPVLLKAKGKCTTDHISAAGKWLKFRGHLENISNNMFIGAINAFTGETGVGLNVTNGERGKSFPEIAKSYREQNMGWIVIGDENYGEGSSREHAAMCPRFMGAKAALVRSFARIHETNLKKQGVLPLTFAEPADYDKIAEEDRLSIQGLKALAPGQPLKVQLTHKDGRSEEIVVKHTLNQEQIDWFKAGSALNCIAQQYTAQSQS